MAKTGRNDPCPCGSGKKYKKCCVDKKASPVQARDRGRPHWDDLIRWKTVVNGKTMEIYNQIPVVIDRTTGEPFPEPYVAQLKVDGRTKKVLTRTQKIEFCNMIAEKKISCLSLA